MKTSPPEKLWIMNTRGNRLAALLYRPCRAYPSASAACRGGPLVIVCHGFTGSKEGGGRAAEMAQRLGGLGYACLLFDFSGCGESEGRWADISLTGHMEDLRCVVQWSREAGFAPIILNGRSFGGTTVICYAARDREIAGVCTWAAVGRLELLFKSFIHSSDVNGAEQVALNSENGTLYINRDFFYDLEKHDVLACAAQIAPRPLLVIHGTADESVPPVDADLIYRAAGENAELEMISGADHRFSNHTGATWERFFGWLQKHFPGEG